MHRALHAWYKLHGRRSLPWRNTSDPYAIYVSEIMLQQTQVKTVLDRYYGRFLTHFPTLAALAQAGAEDVMKQWEGLGYYSRAGNLQAAARQSGGVLPQTVDALMKLPGIGRNTASAVACFAFKVPAPVMEANVRRILYRVFALEAASEATLWEKAELLLDRKNPFDYNQAMMDVGALICTKRSPRCGICPLRSLCKGKISPELYPSPKPSRQIPVRKRRIVVFEAGKGRYFLVCRASRFLKGLYGFMEYEEGSAPVKFLDMSYALTKTQLLGSVTQTYSHFTLEAKVYHVPVAVKPKPTLKLFTLREINVLPLSMADRKIIALLEASSLSRHSVQAARWPHDTESI